MTYNHAQGENKLFRVLTRAGAVYHKSQCVTLVGADTEGVRNSFLADFDDEARRYCTKLGSYIARPTNLPDMYDCKRTDYEHMVYISAAPAGEEKVYTKGLAKGKHKAVLASCYWDPFWWSDDNTKANANYFILSAIADASQSSRKTEAYQYAHLLCLEADATRDPQGEGFKALKELALANKDIHGKVFSSVWAYVESRRFNKSTDEYKFPSSWPYTTEFARYRAEDSNKQEAEGNIFCAGLFVDKSLSQKGPETNDLTFFAIDTKKGQLPRKGPEGYGQSEHYGDINWSFNTWFVNDSTGEHLPADPDLLTFPPLNHEFVETCRRDADFPPENIIKAEDFLAFDEATSMNDELWKNYWQGTEDEEEENKEKNKTDDPENFFADFKVDGKEYKVTRKAEGTDEAQKRRYRADAAFNAFKDKKASTRALQPIQWSYGYEDNTRRSERAEMALLYLEARARSARGFAALSSISRAFTNKDSDIKATAARAWAEQVQVWLEEEGIKYDTDISKNHHEEPIMYGGKVSIVWRYGKQGPYPTMIKDAFTGKNKRAAQKHDPFTEENHDLNQAQRGHYMMLGRFPGVVDPSPTGREAAQKVGETFWIMNKDAPPNTESRWIPSGSGSVENVWLSNARDSREEAERAYAADRPPYFLVRDLEEGRAMEDRNGTEFVTELNHEKSTVLKLGTLLVWVRDEHGQLVQQPSLKFQESGNYYPSLVNPYSTIPNPTVIASVAAPAAAAQSGDYSDDYDNYDYSGDYSDDYSDEY